MRGQPGPAPDDGLTTRQRRSRPALIVNTGDGKGKTTAAMGLALRAWNQGWSTVVVQFIKSGKWVTGEREALRVLDAEHRRTGAGGPIEFLATGAGRGWVRASQVVPEGAELSRLAWQEVARRLSQQRHRLYVLDEFTYPLARGWLDTGEVIATLRRRPGSQHIVVTGRGAPAALLEVATTVTDMRTVRHPFDTGQKGQAGIEW